MKEVIELVNFARYRRGCHVLGMDCIKLVVNEGLEEGKATVDVEKKRAEKQIALGNPVKPFVQPEIPF